MDEKQRISVEAAIEVMAVAKAEVHEGHHPVISFSGYMNGELAHVRVFSYKAIRKFSCWVTGVAVKKLNRIRDGGVDLDRTWLAFVDQGSGRCYWARWHDLMRRDQTRDDRNQPIPVPLEWDNFGVTPQMGWPSPYIMEIGGSAMMDEARRLRIRELTRSDSREGDERAGREDEEEEDFNKSVIAANERAKQIALW